MIDFDKLKQDLISFGFKESVNPVYLVSKTDNTCIEATIPNNYGEMPQLLTTNNNYFKTTSHDVILMFYQGITMHLNFKTINGHKPFINNTKKQNCCYCSITIQNNKKYIKYNCAKLSDSSYYYCLDCLKPMCPLCHSETDIYSAFRNKTNLKKFEKRVKFTSNCIDNHNMTYIPAKSINTIRQCDICSDKIETFNSQISDSLQIYSFTKNTLQWYTNLENDFDMCMTCSLLESSKKIINDNKLEITTYKPVCDSLKFGSILDWIPIYVSIQCDFILYNLNKDSPYYKKLAYCSNDRGFDIYVINTEINLDTDVDIQKMNDKISRCHDYNSVSSVFSINCLKYDKMIRADRKMETIILNNNNNILAGGWDPDSIDSPFDSLFNNLVNNDTTIMSYID